MSDSVCVCVWTLDELTVAEVTVSDFYKMDYVIKEIVDLHVFCDVKFSMM